MLTAVNLIAGALVVTLLFDYLRDVFRVRRFVGSLGAFAEEPLGRALELAARIANRPRAEADPVYLSERLRSFGATGDAVIRKGGCCSGTSRLYMLALGALGLRANQITVYHQRGHAQHCLVEVHLPGGSAIIDPVYAVYYTDTNGGLVGLEQLQQGTATAFRPVPGANNPGYPDNDYYNFDLTLTKTANWTRSWPRRAAYALLVRASRGGVDRMRVPQFFESPQTLLATMLASAMLLLSGIALAARWMAAT